MGSEVESFPHLIERVGEVDPTRAEALSKGLEEIQQAAPSSRPSKAKELLEELQPAMN